MTRVVTVLGARPQFIKAAVVSRALRERQDVQEILVHTGQHFDSNMSEVFFTELAIPTPDHNLGIAGGSHGRQTGRMLEQVEEVLLSERPDWVLVYGDTNSTLAGALAAAKLNVPVAHVEAGLRSFNRRMPEEINRVMADHVSTVLFAPTSTAVENLHREGIGGDRVQLVGDVMYDSVLHYGRLAEERSRILEELGIPRGGYVLATIHRQENTEDPARLEVILQSLGAIAEDLPVVLPLHPRTRQLLDRGGAMVDTGPLRITEPLGYLDMLMLERHARLIATDSGGVQKEAYLSRVPCVTLRDETEWVELVDAGWNTLAPPTDAERVKQTLRSALSRPTPGAGTGSLYGDGRASERIAAVLASSPGSAPRPVETG
jgi:UDP-GlcNAc3NAcA epimerase